MQPFTRPAAREYASSAVPHPFAMDSRFQSPLVRTAFALATAIGLAIVLFHADPRALPGSTGTIEHTDLSCLERVGSVFGGCSDSTSCTEELLSPVYYLDSTGAHSDVAISLAGGPGHGMYVVFTLYVGGELVGTTQPLYANEAEELRIPSLAAGRTQLRIGARSPEGNGINTWEAVVHLPEFVSLLQVSSGCGDCVSVII